MKYAAFSIVYNEERLIQGCINTWKSKVDKHIVLISIRPFHGASTEPDSTYRICHNNKVMTIQRDWRNEHEMRNCAVALLKDYDYIFVNDADMWLTGEDVDNLKKEIEETKQDAYIIPQRSYWYDTSHCLVGDDFKPVIAIRPHVRFVHIGNVDRPCAVVQSALCHHLNWCKPKDILKKVQTYAHANEMTKVEDWYKNHFENWREGVDAVMPIQNNEQKTFKVDKCVLPKELQNNL